MTPKPKHPGGRPPGSRNKATLERIEKARIAEQMLTGGTPEKLGKQVLRDFMELFAGMAAAYQPLPPGVAVPPGRHPDEARFEKYARLAVDAAAKLAEYQSPKFRAIVVHATPQQTSPPPPSPDNVLEINDPQAAARVYMRRIQRVG